MSTELTKKYDELLNYLSQQKELRNENCRTNESSHKVQDKIQTSNKTDEIIRSCQEDLPENDGRSDKGFDVKKLEKLMRTKLIDEYKRLQSYTRPYISVSELTSCLRQAYYYRKKYSIDVNKKFSFSYLYLINKVGSSIHNVIQELYDFSEVEKTVISEKYGVKGRVDAIRMNNLYELKSTDPGKIRNLPANYNQGLIYGYILNNEYDYDIRTITLVYVERNLRNIIVYDYSLDNHKAEGLLQNAIRLNKSLTENKVPEPINSDSEQCNFCAYRYYCEKDKSELRKPFEISDDGKNAEDNKAKSNVKFLLGG